MPDAGSRPRLGFVGAGRVGRGLSLAFSRCGYTVAVARRRGSPIAQEVVERADIVFLTVPDDAIAGVAAKLRWRPAVAAVHCSGAADLSVLESAAAAGAAVGGFHPLQMFADPEVAASGLARCSIAIEAGEPLAGTLREMVEALPRTACARSCPSCAAASMPSSTPGLRTRWRAPSRAATHAPSSAMCRRSVRWMPPTAISIAAWRYARFRSRSPREGSTPSRRRA